MNVSIPGRGLRYKDTFERSVFYETSKQSSEGNIGCPSSDSYSLFGVLFPMINASKGDIDYQPIPEPRRKGKSYRVAWSAQ